MPNNLNKAIIVGVDYGYGNVKTVNNIFASTLKELPVKPSLPRKTIEFEGKYYAIGSGKIGIQKSKTDDSTMLILTAAAIASELSMKGIREGNVILAVGTVLTRLGAEKKDFIEYYKRHRELEFRYEDDFFRLHIQSVEVFPQGYAAIVPHMTDINKRSCVVVDMGSYTVDALFISDGVPDMTRCKSLPMGTITLIQDTNEAIRQKYGFGVEESHIIDVMRGLDPGIPDEYISIIRSNCRKYMKDILDQLRAIGMNPEVTQTVFIGGGACLMKEYLDPEAYPNSMVIDDIHINAKGYECLTRRRMGI